MGSSVVVYSVGLAAKVDEHDQEDEQTHMHFLTQFSLGMRVDAVPCFLFQNWFGSTRDYYYYAFTLGSGQFKFTALL